MLPLSTRIVIALSTFLRNFGIYILLFGFLAIIGTSFAFKKSVDFRFQTDRYLLKIPLLGKMAQYYNLANTCRTLGLLLKSGIGVGSALLIAAETTENLVYKKELGRIAKAADRGEELSLYLEKNPELFPTVLSQMIAVGEKTGNLSETLMYLSELYEYEVDDFSKNLSTMVEPALMIVMGILVGFIAISIITPIYGLTQNLHA